MCLRVLAELTNQSGLCNELLFVMSKHYEDMSSNIVCYNMYKYFLRFAIIFMPSIILSLHFIHYWGNSTVNFFPLYMPSIKRVIKCTIRKSALGKSFQQHKSKIAMDFKWDAVSNR